MSFLIDDDNKPVTKSRYYRRIEELVNLLVSIRILDSVKLLHMNESWTEIDFSLKLYLASAKILLFVKYIVFLHCTNAF